VRWFCWSGSAPFRHDSVLLLCNQKLAHDSIFLISNRRHAPTPNPDVCSPTAPGAGLDAELPPTWPPSPQPHPENRSARLFRLSVDRTCQHPKSIAPKFQTASFKSLYQKRSGERDPCVSPKLIAPERFRYSTKTSFRAPSTAANPTNVAACRSFSTISIPVRIPPRQSIRSPGIRNTARARQISAAEASNGFPPPTARPCPFAGRRRMAKYPPEGRSPCASRSSGPSSRPPPCLRITCELLCAVPAYLLYRRLNPPPLR